MDDDIGAAARCGAATGGACTGVGVGFPLVLMVWNTLVQSTCGIVTGVNSFVCGCNPCICGAIGICGAQCLTPVWWCSQPLCACGSCSALGTVWLQIITFAGFTGAAWYIGLADAIIVIGLFILLVTGILYGYAKINEPSESTAAEYPSGPRTSGFKEMKLTVCESIETGQMKF